MSDCLYYRIAGETSKANIAYKDEHVTAFRNIHPVAPTHILGGQRMRHPMA